MGNLFRNTRAAVRSLRRAPGFSLTVVSVLALGIGANTALFSVIDGVLLRPLSYREPEGLVWFYETNPERGWDRAEVAPANFLDWRERASSFSDITALQDWPENLTLQGQGEPEVVQGIRVFGNFFSVLGVRPILGRGLDPEESWAGQDGVVVLSYGFWQRRFGGDPNIVGRTLLLDGAARTVIGVAPADFRTPEVIWTSPTALAGAMDVWVPFGWDPAIRDSIPFRRAHVVQAIGRLDGEVGLEAAGAELATIASRLAEVHPETNRGMGVGVERLQTSIVSHARLPLLLVMGGVSLVLFIACTNVANLSLVRALERRRRTAIHSALGAGPWQLLSRDLTESIVLAIVGGAAGLLVAMWGTPILAAAVPENIPRVDNVSINGSVLIFTFAVTVATGLLFGLVPALRDASVHPVEPLREGRWGGGMRSRLAGRALVTVEVAIAVVLVAGTGLLLRTVQELRGVELGFEPEGVVAAGLALPAASYPDFASITDFQRRLLERAAGLPGVESVALASHLPMEGGWRSDFAVDGWEADRYGMNVLHREVSPDYFETLRIPIIAGRVFDPRDVSGGPPVVVINRTLAERYFPAEDPLGRRIAFERSPGETSVWYTIVGIVGDQRQQGPRAQPDPAIFAPVFQATGRSTHLIARATGEPAAVLSSLHHLVGEVDSDLPTTRAVVLAELVADSVARESFLLTLIGAFAVMAVVLALLGVYGITAHAERWRSREMGVRAALGANPAKLLKDSLGRGMVPVIVGGLVGLGAALVAGPALRAVLFGVVPTDPLALGAALTAIVLVGLAACWIPARRAAQVDPATAMRSEG